MKPVVNPGLAGWIGMGAVAVIADGYAKHKQAQGFLAADYPTMSDEFARNYGWGVVLLAGTFAHLITHRRV